MENERTREEENMENEAMKESEGKRCEGKLRTKNGRGKETKEGRKGNK
jgi:hypothetical protein